MAGPGEWYRYHALFAEAMRREASRRLGEAMLQERALRASQWYEQAGMLTEAIEAAWLALDLERMARLIEQIDVLNFYEPQTMRRWLERLPEQVLREHPMLCHLFAIELRFPVELRFSAMPVSELHPLAEAERIRIEMLLQMAEDSWRRSGILAWIGANRAFCALSALLNGEPFPAVVNYAQQALVFLPQAGELDVRLQMYRSSCRLFVATEKLRLGQISEAQQLLHQAQADNVPPGNKYLAADIRLMLGKCHLLQGELKLASRYLRQALCDAKELSSDELAIDALLELAWIAFEWNDLADAEQQARAAQELAQRLHPQRLELADRVALQLALLQHVQGDTTAALEQVTAMLAGSQHAWTSESCWLLARLRDWHGRLRIATGDLQAVQASLDAQSQSSEIASITENLGAEILRGRLWLAQGKVEAAQAQFTRLLPLAQESLHQYATRELELLLALTYAAGQQEQQAHSWLRQALVHAVHEDYIRLFLNEGKPMIQLLRSLLGSLAYDTVLRAYLQRILRATARASRSQQGSAAGAGPLLEPLTTQEQRVLQLLVAGYTNQEIARELVVSVNTVKYHTKHLYQKLGVSNRLQASAVARTLLLNAEDQ
jgi:LuxR family maltose regulon positive regulatory protein